MKYRFCPLCGQRLEGRMLGDEGLVPYCESCTRPFFDSFTTCIIVAVADEYDKIAVLKHAGSKGTYRGLVAGYIKPGETAEETARREVAEELGLSVGRLALVQTYWFEPGDQLMIGFIARTQHGEFSLSGEIEAAEWMTASHAQNHMRPGGPAWRLVECYMHELAKKG